MFRVLYQSEVGDFPFDEVLSEVVSELKPSGAVADYALLLGQKIREHRADIDRIISEVSRHWRLERMAVTDRNILRIAVAELGYIQEVPARVAIDEGIELAKKYGDEGSGRFVNGILDTVAKRLRSDELSVRGRNARATGDSQ